jgi:hypothetical protein
MVSLRTPEMAADRVRDIRQTGLTTGTLNEIAQDAEEDMQQVRDKSEIEDGRVRTDAERESPGEQEKPERKEPPPIDEDEELRRRASAQLLNLPVVSKNETETKRFDIRV